MKPQKLAFEINHCDDSGVEFAVRYNEADVGAEIEFESGYTALFPIEKVDWLINALVSIKNSTQCKKYTSSHMQTKTGK